MESRIKGKGVCACITVAYKRWGLGWRPSIHALKSRVHTTETRVTSLARIHGKRFSTREEKEILSTRFLKLPCHKKASAVSRTTLVGNSTPKKHASYSRGSIGFHSESSSAIESAKRYAHLEYLGVEVRDVCLQVFDIFAQH